MASSVMRRVSLRNLRAHKIRLFLTVFSIVLGTAFVAGSIVFTSTISKGFTDIFDSAAPGVAVEVTAKGDARAIGVPDEAVDTLKQRRDELGIDRLTTDYTGTVTIAGGDGKALQTGGAPSVGTAYVPPSQSLSPKSSKILPGGRAPENSGEVALNADAAEKGGLKVGSKTKLVVGQGASGPKDVTVVGLFDLPASTGGYVNVQFDSETARSLFSDGSHVAQIDMSAKPGVTPDQLRERVASALPADTYNIRTGDQVRQDQKDQVNQFLTVFTAILLAFAAIGLIVGTFIIYNTFSMIVAQRNRELALLRAVGAGQRQVSNSVLLEAFIVGVIGGAVGLAAGVGLAALLKTITVSQSGLPSAPLQVGVWAVLASIFVGVGVTMVSAWVPAVRASRVPPVEAMRASAAEGSASLRLRTVIGVIVGVAGLAGIFGGALGGVGVGPATLVGVGAAAAIASVVMAGPALSRPVIGALGTVVGAPFGKIGQLARTNAVRNPRRSAATAFALTLGIMLVAVIGTLGTSFKGTVDSTIDNGISADYMLRASSNAVPIPTTVYDAARTVPGVGTAVTFNMVPARVDGERVVGFSPIGGKVSDVVELHMQDGASDVLPEDAMFVSQRTSAEKGWKRGDTVTLSAPSGDEVKVPVAGVYADNEALQPFMVGSKVFDTVVPPASRVSALVLVTVAPGADSAKVRTGLENATGSYLTVQVLDREQFKSAISSQIDQMLTTLYAMLALALIIAVLGIINTLALSVVERTREIGMLRAVGMLRSQVRRSIYLESVLIAVFGALVGVILGTVIGWALVKTLAKWGLGDPVLPWSLIGITLIGSAIVGVAAALWPAVRAARTGPLEAIAEA